MAKKRLTIAALAIVACLSFAWAMNTSGAASQLAPFMYCDPPSTISQIRPAVDETHVGAGRVTPANGANFENTVPHPTDPTPGSEFVAKLRKTDKIQMCYAPLIEVVWSALEFITRASALYSAREFVTARIPTWDRNPINHKASRGSPKTRTSERAGIDGCIARQ